MFTEITIGGVDYKLRLTTRASIAIEKALGYNPMNVFIAMEDGSMPKLGDMVIILHGMLQPLNHGITLEKTYDLFDTYAAEGHSMFDLVNIFVEVFQESGYMPKSNGEIDEKN
jgi:hypothetical protein